MSNPLNFKQELTACFGQPVAENPTQVMMEAAFRHHGLDWRYLTIEIAPSGLAAAVAGARAMGFRGFNCTIPHKVAVIDHLDGLGESAALMGAVNCVVRRGDKLIGENTDGKGFVKSLKELIDPTGKRVVMFGAGGAARAIGVEVALAGATHVTIVNRSKDRGDQLAGLLKERVPAETNLCALDRSLRYSAVDGHRDQRNLHRSISRRRRPARLEHRNADVRDGRRGRHSESTKNQTCRRRRAEGLPRD